MKMNSLGPLVGFWATLGLNWFLGHRFDNENEGSGSFGGLLGYLGLEIMQGHRFDDENRRFKRTASSKALGSKRLTGKKLEGLGAKLLGDWA